MAASSAGPSPSPPVLPALPGAGEPPLPPWPGRIVRAGATALFVRHAEGPFVDAVAAGRAREPGVFVHGLGGAATNWTDLMGLLAPWLDGYAPDLPGFGRSEPPPDGRYTVDASLAALHAFVCSRDSAPVHLFANSMGGVVCTRFAARHPDLVRSLTLVSPALPSYRLPSGMSPLMLLALLPGARTVLGRRLATPTPEQRAAQLLELCYADPSRVSAQRRQEAVEDITARSSLAWDMTALSGATVGLIRSYLVPPWRSLWRDAGTVRVPVLLVWGRQDRLVPVALAESARRAFPDASLVVFDDAGHVSQLEKPVETARAILDFLPGVAGR